MHHYEAFKIIYNASSHSNSHKNSKPCRFVVCYWLRALGLLGQQSVEGQLASPRYNDTVTARGEQQSHALYR